MGNRIVIAVAVILLTLSLLSIEMHADNVTKANPVPYPPTPNFDLPIIQVQLPQNYSTTFANNSLNLNFTVTKPNSWNSYWLSSIPAIGDYWVYVYLDGTEKYYSYNAGIYGQFTTNYTVAFSNLAPSQHTAKIKVSARTFYKNTNPANSSLAYNDYRSDVTQTVVFQIDANSQTILFAEDPAVIIREPYPNLSPSLTPTLTPTQSPSSNRSLIVTVDSPQNQTYTSNRITVSVSTSDPAGQIGPEFVAYILDGNPQVIIGETPVMGLHSLTNSSMLAISNGSHCIVGVGITWFNGADGVFYSPPVYFTVNTSFPSSTPTPITTPPEPTTEPTQTPDRPQVKDFAPVIIPASMILLVIVAVGLLVYFSKHRGKRQ